MRCVCNAMVPYKAGRLWLWLRRPFRLGVAQVVQGCCSHSLVGCSRGLGFSVDASVSRVLSRRLACMVCALLAPAACKSVSWSGRRGAARPAVEVSVFAEGRLHILLCMGGSFVRGPVPAGARLSRRRAVVWMRSGHNEASQPFGSLFRQVSSSCVGSGQEPPSPVLGGFCLRCAAPVLNVRKEPRGTCRTELRARRVIMHAKHVPFI